MEYNEKSYIMNMLSKNATIDFIDTTLTAKYLHKVKREV